MRIRTALAALLVAGSACATRPRPIQRPPPLAGEGEVQVYLLALPREAERLTFTIESVALRRADGSEVPLVLTQPTVSGAEPAAQRRLAWGRVPPGEYAGLLVKPGTATVTHDDERTRLLVAADPAAVDLHFAVDRGAAAVLWLSLKVQPIRAGAEFSPSLSAMLSPQTPPQIALYCTDAGASSVTVIDRRARLLTGEIPVGDLPRGVVIDRTGTRAYVALGGDDQIQVLDAAANASIERIRLTPGDGPRELALAADGTTLLSLNERSRTLAFVDVVGKTELGRVPVGDAPVALLLDRSGLRAYVVNRSSATITVVDVPRRTVIASLPTDAEPLRAQLSRDGSRLYVVHRGSAYLTIFALPSLALQPRAYVGLGVTTLKVDPRTDLLYLSRGDERRISVYDPVSFQPIDHFDVPGAVSYMAIDDAENTLLALVPERRAIAVIDLTSRKLLAELPVGADPYSLTLVGERF